MKFKFTFWEISLNGQVLNYTFTYKAARKWADKWMEQNVEKRHQVLDHETGLMVNSDEFIYNGTDKVKIKECIVNDERKTPAAIVSLTYYHTED